MFSFFFFLRINKTSGQAHQEEKREDPNKPTKKPKNTSAHCTITVISVCLSRQTLSIDGNTTEPNIFKEICKAFVGCIFPAACTLWNPWLVRKKLPLKPL